MTVMTVIFTPLPLTPRSFALVMAPPHFSFVPLIFSAHPLVMLPSPGIVPVVTTIMTIKTIQLHYLLRVTVKQGTWCCGSYR
jgi:hypothetical protein